jgi:hypothetical protein
MRMMRMLVAGFVLATFGSITALAQTEGTPSAVFRIEELVVPPSSITATNCIQIGIFVDYSGPTMNWAHYEASFDFTLPAGITIDGTPFVNVTDFANPPKAGITSPGQVQSNSNGGSTSCAVANIINSATLGGADVPLATGLGGVPAIVTENVIGMAVDITSLAFSSTFQTVDGESYLMAILEIPIAGSPSTGQLDMTFRTGAADNFLTDGVSPLNSTNGLTFDDGFLQIFETINCGDGTNFAVFDDNIGTGSASTSAGNATLDLNYRDNAFGGPTGGAQMDVTVNFGNPVIAYQITGSDGFDTGQVSVVSPGSDTLMINPDAANASNTYTLTFFVLGLDGITPTPGSSCTLTQGWNAPSCNATWTNNGIGGPNSTFDVDLTNTRDVAGLFAQVDVPDGSIGVTDPIDITAATSFVSGTNGTATLRVIDQSLTPTETSWAGTWTVMNYANPAGTPGTNCSANIGFDPPVNNSTVSPVAIGSPATVQLLGTGDIVDWDVDLDGTTSSGLADGSTHVTVNNVTSTSVLTTTANGFDMGGNPAPDTNTLTLDYVAPTCVASQNPDSTVTPVDVGTVITLTLMTTGAISADLDGVPMTAVSGVVGVDDNITWEATHTAVADTTLTAVATNPDGETATCTFPIDINCIDPIIVSIGPLRGTGITIFGTPGCDYTVRVTDHDSGVSNTATILAGTDGFGTDNTLTLSPDSWIEVGQLGLPVVTDSFMTVPTLGQWGLIAFVSLLMIVGIGIIRKRRLA